MNSLPKEQTDLFCNEALIAIQELLPLQPFDEEERKLMVAQMLIDTDPDSPLMKAIQKILVEISRQVHYEIVNRCMICQVDIGIENPRQLCGKTYCENGAAAPKKRKTSPVFLPDVITGPQRKLDLDSPDL